MFPHNPFLQGETSINHPHTRQTSGFLSLAALKPITADMCCVWEKKPKRGFEMQTVTYCRLSSLLLSPHLCSLSVSSLGGRWQVSSRQEQQPFTSSNVLTFRKRRTRTIQGYFSGHCWENSSWKACKCSYALLSQVVHGTGEKFWM